MTAVELRIGNYVSIKNHINLCKVVEIKEQTLRVEYFREDVKLLHRPVIEIERIKPIPLTEEWLLKFGFDLINNEYHQSRNHDLKLHWTVNKNKMIPEFNEKRFVTGYDFKYVHQLQNLYFALTSEELTIKK